MQIQINGRKVKVSGDNVLKALDSEQFQGWLKDLDSRFEVRAIHFQSVDLDVRADKEPRVRFIKFRADLVLDGMKMRQVVFMRGGSVAILVVLVCEGEEHALLTRQARFAAGFSDFLEIPAGTLENDGTVAVAAVRELYEETDIVVKAEDLVDLVELIYGDRFKGIFGSPGACDEFFGLLLLRMEITRQQLTEFQGKFTGLIAEGEKIKLRVVPLRDLALEVPDAKSLSALALYETAKRLGKV